MSWGVFEAPSSVHPFAREVRGKWVRTSSRSFLGLKRAALTPWEWTPCQSQMPRPPRDHGPSQKEEAAVRSPPGSFMAVHVCVRACVCLSVCASVKREQPTVLPALQYTWNLKFPGEKTVTRAGLSLRGWHFCSCMHHRVPSIPTYRFSRSPFTPERTSFRLGPVVFQGTVRIAPPGNQTQITLHCNSINSFTHLLIALR